MLETPQIIDFYFADQRYRFSVFRYTTDQELLAALHRDKVRDPVAYKKGTIAYTDCYEKGDECGRIYLLDKSVETLAHEAVHMALHILSLSGETVMPIAGADDVAPDIEEKLCQLTGAITSDLYSKNKHF